MTKFYIPLIFLSSWLLFSCGSSSPSQSDDPIPEELENTSDEVYIGMTIEDATELADARDIPNRVVNIDGEPQIVTADYLPERLNFTIANGIVTSVERG